jgi:hypothetical protein
LLAVIARSECDEAIQFFFTTLDRFAIARDDEFWTKTASPDKSMDHFSARHPFSSKGSPDERSDIRDESRDLYRGIAAISRLRHDSRMSLTRATLACRTM